MTIKIEAAQRLQAAPGKNPKGISTEPRPKSISYTTVLDVLKKHHIKVRLQQRNVFVSQDDWDKLLDIFHAEGFRLTQTGVNSIAIRRGNVLVIFDGYAGTGPLKEWKHISMLPLTEEEVAKRDSTEPSMGMSYKGMSPGDKKSRNLKSA